MAAVFFFYGGITQDLSDPSNLWSDSGHSTPFVGLPSSSDDLSILGSTMPTSNTLITDLLSWDSSTADIGTSIPSNVTSLITIHGGGIVVGVLGDATSAHVWAGSNTGGTSFIAQGGATHEGDGSHTLSPVVFKDSSQLKAILSSQTSVSINFYNTSQLSSGGYTTDSASGVVFHDSSKAVGGNIIAGTVVFNNTSQLAGATLDVNSNTMVVTFNNASQAISGTTTNLGTLTFAFNNTAQWNGMSTTVTSVTLNNTSQINSGMPTVNGALTVNDNATIVGGTTVCDTLVLNSLVSVNGGTITCSGNITGAQVSSGSAGLSRSRVFAGF